MSQTMQSPKSVLRVLAMCVALGAVPAVVIRIFTNVSPREFWLDVLHGIIYGFCIGVPCWLTLPRALYALDGRSVRTHIAAGVSLLAVFSVGGCFAGNVILVALRLIRPVDFWANFSGNLRICVLMTFTFGAFLWALSALLERLQLTKEQLQARQIAEERERKIAAEARFASLESRVHPHFLFNTLNSISALVREDPAQAERTIERLAALLRFSLDSELAGVVTLREELRIVRDYLEIEKVRFGERLRYRIETDEPAGSHQVPALSIQTLVENSVKYAVGASREGAEILVSAHLQDGKLRVEVSDDGPGFEPAASVKPGHGLDLLQRRLAALFGSAASLEVSGAPGRTMVAISLTA